MPPFFKDRVPKTFWALILIYQPFRMGPSKLGNMMFPHRYPVQGTSTKIAHLDCFHFFNEKTKMYQVHDATTGGLLGEGGTVEVAEVVALKNVESTPDLKKQMDGVGPIEKNPEISYEKAMELERGTR